MTYLLDTDMVIHMIRGLKTVEVKSERQRERKARGRRIFEHARQRESAGHEVALSALSVAELEFGARKSEDYSSEMAIVRRVLTPFILLDFGSRNCAVRYGEIRHSLESAGRGIGGLDTLIAAHALAVGATLVTNNRSEFGRVPALKLENWAE